MIELVDVKASRWDSLAPSTGALDLRKPIHRIVEDKAGLDGMQPVWRLRTLLIQARAMLDRERGFAR